LQSPDALAGPFEDIPINAQCQSMDYEVSRMSTKTIDYAD